ncbi:MAG: hypothetical protein HY706_04105 [Candidatus Hydrogenedentes bacterium]|nr:hypothetical protein [Candidatus Hydrogenedentota bacterium]
MSFIVLVATAAVVGSWVLRPLRLPANIEGFAFRLWTGLCLCALLILAVGSFSLRAAQFATYAVALLALTVEVILLLLPYKARHVEAATSPGETTPVEVRESGRWSFMEVFAAGATVSALTLALVSALAPVMNWDAASTYLALPADYVREGRIRFLEGNTHSGYPQFMLVLHTYALQGGGESAATLVNWTIAVLACMTAYGLGERWEGRKCGLLSAAFLATTPIFIREAGMVAPRLAFAGLSLAGVSALVAWRQDRRHGSLLLAGFFAGSTCGIEYAGYLVSALLFLDVALTRNRPVPESGSRVADLKRFGVTAFCAAGPWLLGSYLMTGNPIYPFHPSVPWLEGFAKGQIPTLSWPAAVNWSAARDFLMYPWNVVMRAQWYGGWVNSPGCLVLLLGVPGLLVGGNIARRLGAFSIGGGIVLYFLQPSARALLPFFLPLMVVAAVAACRMRGLRFLVSGLLGLAFVFGIAYDIVAVHGQFPVVSGRETREQYLERHVARYAAFQWVNDHLDHDDTILTFDPRAYYFRMRTYQNYDVLKRIGRQSVRQQRSWLRARDIRYVFVPESYFYGSPVFDGSGLRRMLNVWKRDPRHFVLRKTLVIPRPNSGGTERVEIYEVLYPPGEHETEYVQLQGQHKGLLGRHV